MSARFLPFAAAFAFACGSPPPPLQVTNVTAVRVQAVNEDGDEWLHDHCVFRGTAVVGDYTSAVATALARQSNFVEPLYRSTSSSSSTNNGVVTSASFAESHPVVLFSCSENPPW